jgi:hypothetical protein
MRLHQRTVGLPAVQVVAAPGVSPSGLAWDGQQIWSCDTASSLVYRHGKDLSTLESIKSIIPAPQGLAADEQGLWVIGGQPLLLAHLERAGRGWLWTGPYDISNILGEGVEPSGVAVGFGRLWLVSGGNPTMSSRSLAEITRQLKGWKATEMIKEEKKEQDAAGKA